MSELYQYDQVQDYLASLVPARPAELAAMEIYAQEKDFPIIGPVAGYYCYQVARMTGALTIFEMGSGFGYSTAWFAKAVEENCKLQRKASGVVHHVVWNQELSDKAKTHLAALNLDKYVEYHVSEAVATLETAKGMFDLIFCDIDKDGYPAALDVIEKKLLPGGVLIIDNMLWHSRIFNPADTHPSTNGVREFTRRITSSPGWIVSLSPLRDGVIVAYKNIPEWDHQD